MNGGVHVVSLNRTEARIKANASATKSSIGVGVAVAINIVNIDNIARIGDAAIIANTLDVQAIIKHPSEEEEESEDNEGNGTTLFERMKELLTEKIEELAIEMGLARYSSAISGGISKIVSGTVEALAAELVSGTGFDNLMTVPIESFTSDAYLERLASAYLKIQGIPQKLLDKLESIVDAAMGEGTFARTRTWQG